MSGQDSSLSSPSLSLAYPQEPSPVPLPLLWCLTPFRTNHRRLFISSFPSWTNRPCLLFEKGLVGIHRPMITDHGPHQDEVRRRTGRAESSTVPACVPLSLLFFFLFFHKPRARARGMRHFDKGLTTLFLFSGLVGASQWFNADMTSFPHEKGTTLLRSSRVCNTFEAGVGASASEKEMRLVSKCLNRPLRRRDRGV